jgi:iron complex outermembrane receptor protein
VKDGEPPPLETLNVLNENIAERATAGIDVNIHYQTDFAWGIGSSGSVLSLGLAATYLDKLDVTPVAVLPDDVNECAGAYGATCRNPRPEYLWNLRTTLTTGDWTFTSLLRYIGETEDDQIALGTIDSSELAEPTIGEEVYLDLGAAYQFSETMSGNIGVNNVLDAEPNKIGSGSNSQGNTWPETYPLFGPRIYVSVSYNF